MVGDGSQGAHTSRWQIASNFGKYCERISETLICTRKPRRYYGIFSLTLTNPIQPLPLFSAFHFQVAAAVYIPDYHYPCQNQTHLKGENSNLGRQRAQGNLNQGSDDEVRDKVKCFADRDW